MRISAVLLLALTCTAVAVAAPARTQVSTHSTTLGSVLVDSRGHTLYVFDLDHGTKSSCTGACTASWHAFLTSSKPVALHGVAASKLGMAKRAGGKSQVTFMGHPLYFYVGDTKAGNVRGAAIAHWAAFSPTGAKLRDAAATTPPPPPTSTITPPGYDTGGGGY
jgi:predicted lipoprotein with Yx(FWY)xxD motif